MLISIGGNSIDENETTNGSAKGIALHYKEDKFLKKTKAVERI